MYDIKEIKIKKNRIKIQWIIKYWISAKKNYKTVKNTTKSKFNCIINVARTEHMPKENLLFLHIPFFSQE